MTNFFPVVVAIGKDDTAKLLTSRITSDSALDIPACLTIIIGGTRANPTITVTAMARMAQA